jgi:hypothetical protein
MIYFQFDQCQNGPRWFWCVVEVGSVPNHGWADTEAGARSAIRSTMVRAANGTAFAQEREKGLAERTLKSARKAEQRQDQADGNTERPRRSKPRPGKAARKLWEQVQAALRPPRSEPPTATVQAGTCSASTLAELRAAAIAAHPDRGGTAEAFRAAWERYEAAKMAAGK